MLTKGVLVFVFCLMVFTVGLAVRSPAFQTTRLVDILQIFVAGVVTGVFVCGMVALLRGR